MRYSTLQFGILILICAIVVVVPGWEAKLSEKWDPNSVESLLIESGAVPPD